MQSVIVHPVFFVCKRKVIEHSSTSMPD